MTSLRVGIVGVGARASIGRHVSASASDARIVAVADPRPAAAGRAREVFGDDVIVLEVLSRPSRPQPRRRDRHHPGLDPRRDRDRPAPAGIAVYLEKPLAITVEDADAVLNAAAETGHAALRRPQLPPRGGGAAMRAGDRARRDRRGQGRLVPPLRRQRRRLLLQGLARRPLQGQLPAAAEGELTTSTSSTPWRRRTRSRVVGMGDLSVYGDVTDRRDRSGELMADWFSLRQLAAREQTGLNPVVDVEDVSMVHDDARQRRAWPATSSATSRRTTGGTTPSSAPRGGSRTSATPAAASSRSGTTVAAGRSPATASTRSTASRSGHADADLLTMTEFLARSSHSGTRPPWSPLAARAAVAAGALRRGLAPRTAPVPSTSRILPDATLSSLHAASPSPDRLPLNGSAERTTPMSTLRSPPEAPVPATPARHAARRRRRRPARRPASPGAARRPACGSGGGAASGSGSTPQPRRTPRPTLTYAIWDVNQQPAMEADRQGVQREVPGRQGVDLAGHLRPVLHQAADAGLVGQPARRVLDERPELPAVRVQRQLGTDRRADRGQAARPGELPEGAQRALHARRQAVRRAEGLRHDRPLVQQDVVRRRARSRRRPTTGPGTTTRPRR